jgi:excisionase family DNA binding protein
MGTRSEVLKIAAPISAQATEREAIDAVADGLMTIPEACAFLRLSRSKLYQLMDTGALQYVKIDGARRIARRTLFCFARDRVVGPR